MATPVPPVKKPTDSNISLSGPIMPSREAIKKFDSTSGGKHGWLDQLQATVTGRTGHVQRWADDKNVKYDEASGKYTGVNRTKMFLQGITDQNIFDARRHNYKESIGEEAKAKVDEFGITKVGNKTRGQLIQEIGTAQKLADTRTEYDGLNLPGDSSAMSLQGLQKAIDDETSRTKTARGIEATKATDLATYGGTDANGNTVKPTTAGQITLDQHESSQALTAQQISTSKTNQDVALAQNARQNDQMKLNWQTLRDTRQTEIERRAHERELQIANNDNLIAHTELMNSRYRDKWESDERIAEDEWQENRIQAIVGGLFAVGGAFAV